MTSIAVIDTNKLDFGKQALLARSYIIMPFAERGRFWPGVRVHKGITIVLSLFRSHWLAVVYCLILCSGSCEPVHEDRTTRSITIVSILA